MVTLHYYGHVVMLMELTALTLIKTGKSRPGQINQHGMTSLLYACSGRMNDTILELLKTGQSKPNITRDFTALQML